MQKINIEVAIGISFILGLILPLVGLGGVFSLFVMGFVATFLDQGRNYQCQGRCNCHRNFLYNLFLLWIFNSTNTTICASKPINTRHICCIKRSIQSNFKLNSIINNILCIWTFRRLYSHEVLYTGKGKEKEKEIQNSLTTSA